MVAEDVLPNSRRFMGCDDWERLVDIAVVIGVEADGSELVDAVLFIQEKSDGELEGNAKDPKSEPRPDAGWVKPGPDEPGTTRVFSTVPAAFELAGEVALVVIVGAELVVEKAVVIPSVPNVKAPVDEGLVGRSWVGAGPGC